MQKEKLRKKIILPLIGVTLFIFISFISVYLHDPKEMFHACTVLILATGLVFTLLWGFLWRIEGKLFLTQTRLLEESRRCEELQRQRTQELQGLSASLEIKVEQRTQELSTLNEILKQDIAERKKAENQCEATALGLRTIMDMADELLVCADADSLFKMAVELARERLHLERCTIFVEEDGYMRGTYGTDRHGRTTDEHSHYFPKNESWGKYSQLLKAHDTKWFKVEDPHLEWDGQKTVEIGKGWIAITPIQSAQRAIGVFVNDTAMSKEPLDESRQAIVAVFCSLLGDITERKRAEEALRESENKFRSWAEHSIVGVYLIQDGLFHYVNPALAEMFDYRIEEMSGRNPRDFVVPVDWPTVEENMRKRTSGELNYIQYNFRGITKNKEIINIEVYGSRIIYRGRPAIIGTALNITERKRAEETLKESRERLNSIISNTPNVAIESYDLEGRVLFWNKAAEQIFGWSKDEAVGKTLDQLILDRQAADKFLAILRETEKSNKPLGPLEWEFKHKSGAIGVISSTIFAIPSSDGKKELICMDIDITESKRAKEERENLTKELLKSNERLKQIALRDSHTGLYNHHYLTEIIEAEFYRAKRYSYPLSIIMLDIDYFKSINDVYGHQFGDLVLKQLAEQLKKKVRRYDIVVRFGGEEFIVISPNTDMASAFNLAQRTLETINLFKFGNKEHVIKLKTSLAVVSYPEDEVAKGMNLIELADQALNKAKEYGGNRVYSSADVMNAKSPGLKKSAEQINIKFLREKLDKLTKRANQSLIEAVFAFAKTIEVKDHYTGEHVERTVHYAIEIAKSLRLPIEQIEYIRQAAILHDLGKVGISERILLKKTELSREEFEKIKKHPQIGVDIIRPIHFLHSVIPYVLYHHERWDGKGYPAKLKKEDIPIGARILAIADSYQALTSDRPYRRAFPPDKAIEIIKEYSGTHFDPDIVNLFLKILQNEK